MSVYIHIREDEGETCGKSGDALSCVVTLFPRDLIQIQLQNKSRQVERERERNPATEVGTR